MKNAKKWGLLFLALAILTVWAVISQSKSFSVSQFVRTLRGASAGWTAAAAVSMLGFIVFEGMAILCILRDFGYVRSFRSGFLYSAADIYFSAITPSATGGQPASAYFMMRSGIPGAVVTITLMANIVMYTVALLTVGIAGFAIRPEIFLQFHLPGRILIAVGYLILCGLTIVFCLMIARPAIPERICDFFLRLGKKLHLVRHWEEKRNRMQRVMAEYRRCAGIMIGSRRVFLKVYLFNLLQRLSQITVTLFVWLAVGGSVSLAPDIWVTQSFVTIGTYSAPIPGGMGVADYLLIDGFRAFCDETTAVNLELISRSISFYVCLMISAATVFVGMIFTARKRKTR